MGGAVVSLPEVLLVDWSSSVPVVPSLTVTGESFDDNAYVSCCVATVGLVAGYYVRAGYIVTRGGHFSLMGWRSERADIVGAEDACVVSALEWCERGAIVKAVGVAS